ncbi:MAG: hypothetical protein ACRD33_05855, partial [Candidatus Acidiferrales bacterium]
MKTTTTSLDKKMEAWFDAIPPTILRYFFLLSLVAGVICSLLTIAGIALIVFTRRSWMTPFRGLESLMVLALFIWATR